jgi:hypothetical protein
LLFLTLCCLLVAEMNTKCCQLYTEVYLIEQLLRPAHLCVYVVTSCPELWRNASKIIFVILQGKWDLCRHHVLVFLDYLVI